MAWAISYDDTAAAAAVREKIARKMDTAKSFGGLLTLALTIVLGMLVDGQQVVTFGHRLWQVQASAVLYLLAAGLYIVTMYSYDSLLMPVRFWGESSAGSGRRMARRPWLVERPPSSDAWVLYQNMMRIWRNLFTVHPRSRLRPPCYSPSRRCASRVGLRSCRRWPPCLSSGGFAGPGRCSAARIEEARTEMAARQRPTRGGAAPDAARASTQGGRGHQRCRRRLGRRPTQPDGPKLPPPSASAVSASGVEHPARVVCFPVGAPGRHTPRRWPGRCTGAAGSVSCTISSKSWLDVLIGDLDSGLNWSARPQAVTADRDGERNLIARAGL